MFISVGIALTSFEWYYGILFSGILNFYHYGVNKVIKIQNHCSSSLILINNCQNRREEEPESRSLAFVRFLMSSHFNGVASSASHYMYIFT